MKKMKKKLAIFLAAVLVVGTCVNNDILIVNAETEEQTTVSGNDITEEDTGEVSAKIITEWNWVNDDELEIQQGGDTGAWELGLPGVSADNQAAFDTIVSMLPTSIIATIQDADQTQELAITWQCENYIQDESGNWPVSGSYTFFGKLPEGYSFADDIQSLEINVNIGGGTTYENTGGFTVIGGMYGVDYTYDSNDIIGTLTVLTSTPLTITTNGVSVNAVIQILADNAHITFKDVVINSNSNLIYNGSKNGWGSIVCAGANPHITIEGTNVITDASLWAGEITCANSAKTLLIDGNGSLTCDKILFYFEENDGTLNVDGPTLSYLTADGISSHSFKNCIVNERTYDANGNLIGNKNAGFFIVSGGKAGTDWIYDDATSMLTIKKSGTYYITGDGVEHNEQINIDANIQVTLYLENVKCKSSYAGMGIQPTSNVTLILEGDNSFIAGNENNAGIEFNKATTGSLVIDGKGSLSVKGGTFGAGIGGGNGSSGNNITIKGGIITATGGTQGAGIGGGDQAAGDNITIKGGSITVTGGALGAGIGGGNGSSGNNITIDGGTITIKRIGQYFDGWGYLSYGAGIGGGNNGAGHNITINGGIIYAENTVDVSGGAGIGGGYSGDGTNITINGGTITAEENYYGAGIGGGAAGNTDEIYITNGSVNAENIGKTPTDGKGNTVYLAKLPKLLGVNSVDVDGTSYTREGNQPGEDGTFYLYLSGTEHTITCDCARFVATRDASATTFTVTGYTLEPVFTISNTDSTATISVSNYKDGYSGETQYACVKKGESLKDSDWGTANTFTGLEPATEYTCYVKFMGNADFNTSNPVSQNFYTNAAAPTASALTIDYSGETISFDDNQYEVNTQNNFNGTELLSGASISNYIVDYGTSEKKLYIRVKGTADGAAASEATEVIIPARNTVPIANVTGGTYQSNQNVALSTQISGADIYYTTNGTEPSRVNGTKYTAAISVTGSEGKSVSTTIKAVAVKDGNFDSVIQSITYVIEIPDTTAPTAEITVGTNKWNSFWNTVTFGAFFKDTKEVTISGEDGQTGVAKIQYYLSDTELTLEQAKTLTDTDWTAYTKAFTLNKTSKQIIYAKVTDDAGNFTIVNSNGIVVYEDSAQNTAGITHIKGVDGDQTAKVILNGNTVAAINDGNKTLTAGTDYTVASDGTITFKERYLESLAASDTAYTMTISYNPMGKSFVSGGENETPAATTLDLTVRKPKLNSITAPGAITGVANGTDRTASALGLPSTVTISTEDSTVTTATVNWDMTNLAGGSYDKTVLTEQTFKVNGTVELPDTIDANGKLLNVTIQVTVDAAPFVGNVSANPAAGSYTENQNVALTTATADAEIYYTTDGSTPSRTNGTKYTGVISVTGAEGSEVITTIKAIAVKAGMQDSEVTSFEYRIAIPDTTAPTAEITVGTNKWNSFWNTVTFGAFFKNTKEVTISGEDGQTGVAKIQYYLSDTELTLDEAKVLTDTDWTAYTKAFTLAKTSKQIIYAKVTDDAGNFTIVNSNGIVIYEDSAQDTAGITHIKGVDGDQTAKVILNGNTVAAINDGNKTLTAGTDYTVASDGTITFKESYLESLAASDTAYTMTISYNPMGESFVTGGENETPAATTLDLTVRKPKLNSITAPGAITGVANGTDRTASALGLPTTVTISTEDSTVTTATVNWDMTNLAGGSYDKTILTEQTFTVNGTIELPDTIDANGTLLNVTIQVTVDAAPFVGNVSANPAAGSYTENQNVALTTATADAEIYYTTDGSTPSRTNGTKYTGVISVTGAEGSEVITTIKAIAVKAGMQDSEVTSFEYRIAIPDTTAPTAEITVGTNKWNSFWNTVTFGAFFKNTKEVTISGEDGQTGVAKIQYYLSDTELTLDEAKVLTDTDWTAYTKAFTLAKTSKQIIYAKVTDDAGNFTIVNSNGIVIYEDSAQDTAGITHIKGVDGDQTAKVILNGNTVAAINDGNKTLTAGTDYTVASDGTITFKESYLESLAASDTAYTMTISYNPMGESFVSGGENETPATTTLSVSVVEGLAPVIITQPADTTVSEGNTATFTIAATGTPEPTYQWQINRGTAWEDISGATSAIYTTSVTEYANNGYQYRCIVTNAKGSVESNTATLTVLDSAVAPNITTQPVDATVVEGNTATFTVVATGTPEPTYQWQINRGTAWEDIPDAISASYTTSVTVIENSGYKYRCLVMNRKASITSNEAVLTVNAAAVTTYNINVTTDGNGTALANITTADSGTRVTLTATPNDGYQFKEWQVLSGGVTITGNTFTMPSCDVSIKAVFEKKASEDTVTYKITDGANGTWIQDSDGNLIIRGNGELSKFVSVKVDGAVIGSENYTATSGSTVITLKKAYLDTLSVGTHTFEIVWTDGSASTTFTIKSPSTEDTTSDKTETPDLPKTGDSSPILLWALVMIASGLGIAGCVVDKKRKKQNK